MKVCSICRERHEDSTVCVQTDPSLSSHTHETPEDLVPGFRLIELIHAGHSDELHRGREESSGRSCLIRIFQADKQCSQDVAREAGVAARLFHPSVAALFESGQLSDGRCFIVSEELEGKTLREVLDHVGSPELLDSIEIVRETAEAIHALHAAGIVHGAVNPSNIVLSRKASGRSTVQIQHPDLGRAKQRSIISNRFLIDSELEALKYFSPEQCAGSDASVQCDVYSLGVVFYEMLAGAPPFDAPTAVGLIHQQQNVAPPEIKIQNFNLRMLVTHALTEALQKPTRLRQSSANVLARQLRHIEQLAKHSSTPPPAGAVPKAEPKRDSVSIYPTDSRANRKPERAIKPAVVLPKPDVAKAVELIEPTRSIVMPDPTPEIKPQPEIIATVPAPEVKPATRIAPRSIFITPRSRLKVLKKKWRSMATRIASETEAQVSSILESGREKIASRTSVRPSEHLSISTPAPATRRKIEWETPEDDIPTISDATIALTELGLNETHAAESDQRAELPATVNPNAIEDVARVIELSSQALPKVVEEIVPETPSQAPVVEAVKVKPNRKPVQPAPVVVPVEHPIAAPIPRTPEIQKNEPPIRATQKVKAPATASVPRMDSDSVTPKRPPQKPARQRSGLGFKVNLADLEEITLVRPPSKRIKIDWARAVPVADAFKPQPRKRQATAPREVEFSPTILGGSAMAQSIAPEVTDEMFSTSDGSTWTASVLRRSALIGGGFVALLALLLFGNDSITRYFQTWSSADSMTAESAAPNETAAPIVAAVIAPKLKAPKKERSVTKERVESAVEPPAVKPIVSAPKAKVATPAVEKPKTSKQTSEPKARPEKKAAVPKDKMTRPRIVKDPTN